MVKGKQHKRRWADAVFPLRLHLNFTLLGVALGGAVGLVSFAARDDHFWAYALIESKPALPSGTLQKLSERLAEEGGRIEVVADSLVKVVGTGFWSQSAVENANRLTERFITLGRQEQSIDREIKRKKLESEISGVEAELARIGQELEGSIQLEANPELLESLRRSLAETGTRKARLAGVLSSGDGLEPKELKQQLLQLTSRRQSLSQTLGPKHPEMLKLDTQIEEVGVLLRAESVRMVSELNRELREVEIAENELRSRLEQQQKLASISSESAERELREQEYHLLTDKHKRLKDELLGIKPLSELVVSSLATTGNGSGSWNALVFPPLLFGILALSLGIVRRRLDPRFFSAGEVESRLGLPVLSRVPRIEWLSGSAIVGAHQSEAWEAYRTLRTALLLNSEGEMPRVIQFTSVQAGEGKTLTSCNLAVALAAAGRRTVLIDADLRNGQVIKALDLEQRAFGLSDLLSGRGSINGLLSPTRFPNLEVIQSGSIVADPSALLSSPRMNDLLVELKRSVDYVIVDSPAMVQCSDALVISASVDGVSLVLKEGGPGAGLVDEALCRLQRVGARVLGVTVNEGGAPSETGPDKAIEHILSRRIEHSVSEPRPAESSLIQPGSATGFARLARPDSLVALRVLDRGAGESLGSLIALEQKLWQERVENSQVATDVLIFAELEDCASIGGFTDTKVVDSVVRMNRGGGLIKHGPGQLTAFLIKFLGSVDPADYLKSFQRILIGAISRLGLDPEAARDFISIGLSVKSKVSMHGAFINLTGPSGGIAFLGARYQPGLNDLKESFVLSLMSEFKYSSVSVLSSVSGNNALGRQLDFVDGTSRRDEGTSDGVGSFVFPRGMGITETTLRVAGGRS